MEKEKNQEKTNCHVIELNSILNEKFRFHSLLFYFSVLCFGSYFQFQHDYTKAFFPFHFSLSSLVFHFFPSRSWNYLIIWYSFSQKRKKNVSNHLCLFDHSRRGEWLVSFCFRFSLFLPQLSQFVVHLFLFLFHNCFMSDPLLFTHFFFLSLFFILNVQSILILLPVICCCCAKVFWFYWRWCVFCCSSFNFNVLFSSRIFLFIIAENTTLVWIFNIFCWLVVCLLLVQFFCFFVAVQF